MFIVNDCNKRWQNAYMAWPYADQHSKNPEIRQKREYFLTDEIQYGFSFRKKLKWNDANAHEILFYENVLFGDFHANKSFSFLTS